jgi:Tol biopolymer transport system component
MRLRSAQSFVLVTIVVCGITVGAQSFTGSDWFPAEWSAQNDPGQSMIDSLTVEKILFSNTPYSGNSEIYVMNTDGSGLQKLTNNHPGRDCGPAWSPDRKKIGFYVHDPNNDDRWSEFVMNADGSNLTQLTFDPNVCDGKPAWSPDGNRIAFGRMYPLEDYRSEIWMMNSDGSHLHRVGAFDGGGPDWSADGSKLVFYLQRNDSANICIVDTDGTNLQQLTNLGTENLWPEYSPDGSKMAFQSNRDGNHEIYVMDSDGTNQVRLTSNPAEDADPCWSLDGSRIAFDSFRDGKYEVYVMNAADGSGQTRLTSMQVHNIQPDWGSVRVALKKYLGQTPPDTIPKRFPPPNLLSDGTWWWHGSPVFSPEGTEMYFVKYISSTNRMEMYYMKIDQNGEWTSPLRPSFASDSGDNSPVFTQDGNRLLFTSYRDGSIKIYQVTRVGTGWSEPEMVNVDYPSLPGSLGWDICLRPDETMYVEIYTPGNWMDIYKSRLENGTYSQFEKLPDQINSASNDATPYVAADESYIVFMSNRPGGFGYHDLYVCFKNLDNTWTPAVNMGNRINGPSEDAMPLLSPDGKYLFFNSEKTGDLGYNAYWVDAAVIAKLNPFPLDTTQRIAFESWRDLDAEIYIMDNWGTNLRKLTANNAEDRWPGFSRDGAKIAFCSNRDANYEVYTMNGDGGNQRRLTHTPDRDELTPDWSPDRSKIAFAQSPLGDWLVSEIHVMRSDGTGDTAITGDGNGDSRPIWSPDGTKILFYSKRDGHYEIYTMNPEGSSQQRLTNSPEDKAFAQWSPDGTRIVYNTVDLLSMTGQVHVMNADGSGDTTLTDAPGVNENPCWSADGSRIVFQSNRDDNYEIYLMNPDGSGQHNLSRNGSWDSWPSWGRRCSSGDADSSGSIDVSDAIYILNYLFRGGPAPKPLMSGDSNNDNEISLADAIYLLNYLFRGGPMPSC